MVINLKFFEVLQSYYGFKLLGIESCNVLIKFYISQDTIGELAYLLKGLFLVAG